MTSTNPGVRSWNRIITVPEALLSDDGRLSPGYYRRGTRQRLGRERSGLGTSIVEEFEVYQHFISTLLLPEI